MLEIILTAVGSLLSGGFVTHIFLNKKYKAEAKATSAEAEAVISTEALKLIESLQKEQTIIKAEVYALRQDNLTLHKQVATLEGEKITMQFKIAFLETELSKYKEVTN